jgi:hypothetical protein
MKRRICLQDWSGNRYYPLFNVEGGGSVFLHNAGTHYLITTRRHNPEVHAAKSSHFTQYMVKTNNFLSWPNRGIIPPCLEGLRKTTQTLSPGEFRTEHLPNARKEPYRIANSFSKYTWVQEVLRSISGFPTQALTINECIRILRIANRYLEA